MSYKITEDCVSCGACAGECLSEAIAEGEQQYMIDPEKCTSCGTCVETCPNEAIVEDGQ